jgi:hypothetical protein
MLLSSYFPNRYKVHILLPMAITIATGLGLLQRVGIARVEASWLAADGRLRWLALACLGLPTAVFAAPLVATALGAAGADPSRLRLKVATLVLCLLALSLVLERCRRAGRRPTFFLLFPVAATLAWLVGQRSGIVTAEFWPTPSLRHPASTWVILVLAAALASAVIAVRGGGRWPSLGTSFVLAGTAYALLALAHLAPGYLAPHYSIRDTSRELDTLLAGFTGTVGSSGGDGLFRENTLRSRTIWGRRWPADRPDVMVIVFAFADPDDVLGREYCQAQAYPLYIAPAYYRAHPFERPTSALGQTALVYRKRLTASCPGARAP